MTTPQRYILALIIAALSLCLLSFTVKGVNQLPQFGGGIGTINQLSQWKSDGTNITQQTASKPIKITGVSTGDCLTLDGDSVLTTTTCGSGGGSDFWTYTSDVLTPATTTTSVKAAYFTATSTTASTFAGNVGIGTTTPAYTLSVERDQSDIADDTPLVLLSTNGTAAVEKGGLLQLLTTRGGSTADTNLFNISNSDGTRFSVRNDGWVGIGTDSPEGELHIYRDAPKFFVEDSQNGGEWVRFSAGTAGSSMKFSNTGSFSIGPVSAKNNTSVIDDFYMESNGRVGINTDTTNARFNVQSDGTADILNLRETGGTEVLTVLESGFVGIGASAPSRLLEVKGSVADATRIRITETGDTTDGHMTGLELYDDATQKWRITKTGSSHDFRIITGGNVQALAILQANGYVGIGSTTPYAALAITNTGTDRSFVVEDSTSPDSTPFIIDASGNVGVGTGVPSQRLHVQGGDIQVTSVGSTAARLLLEDNRASAAAEVSQRSDGRLTLTTRAADYTGTYGLVDILDSGRVGVGETSPDGLLHVNGTIGTTQPGLVIESSSASTVFTTDYDHLKFVNTNTTNGNYVKFGFADSTKGQNAGMLGAFITDHANDYGDIAFWTRSAGGMTEKLRILSTGNVGIGTTTPDHKLDIDGTGSLFKVMHNATTAVLSIVNTAVTALGTWDFSDATVKTHDYPSWTWPGVATTTTATTTVPLGSAYVAEQWLESECRVTASTGGYRYGDGTNFMDYRAASTTESRFALSTNNTFTAGERRVVEVGPLTAAQVTCTVDKIINN